MAPMSKEDRAAPKPKFKDAWADFTSGGEAGRLLVVVFMGTVAATCRTCCEPYGGEILGLSVSATTLLTAAWAAGALVGFGLAARWLAKGLNPYRMCARGLLFGLVAFTAVIFAAPFDSGQLFFAGATLIGFGGGLFSVATLTAAMTMPTDGLAGRGLALGAWGAAQATAAGVSIALGGTIRDLVSSAGSSGALGVLAGNRILGGLPHRDRPDVRNPHRPRSARAAPRVHATPTGGRSAWPGRLPHLTQERNIPWSELNSGGT